MEKMKQIIKEAGMAIASVIAIIAAILAIPSVIIQSIAEFIRVKCQNTKE